MTTTVPKSVLYASWFRESVFLCCYELNHINMRRASNQMVIRALLCGFITSYLAVIVDCRGDWRMCMAIAKSSVSLSDNVLVLLFH